ncbi:MAG: hypothetical protein JO112_02510 [Planctomycetes bacterium]|nr:hypothetical protein [Planctomycetota bacterium]
MPKCLEDFLIKLEANAETALNEYQFLVDVGLDSLTEPQIDVAADFAGDAITIRPMGTNDTTLNSLRIQYLPWRPPTWVGTEDTGAFDDTGVTKALLDDTGPGIFLTSQLNGCRFTIQFHDGGMTKATVLHLAGTYGSNKKGAEKRESLENVQLQNVPTGGGHRRRSSFGQDMGLKKKLNPKTKFQPFGFGQGGRTYYDGNKATILAVRGKDGVWRFFAQEYWEEGNVFIHSKELK